MRKKFICERALVNFANFQLKLSCLPGITCRQLGVLLTGKIPGDAMCAPRGPLQVTLQNAVTERVAVEQREVLLIWEITMSSVWLHLLNLGIRARYYKCVKILNFLKNNSFIPDKGWSYQEVMFISRRKQSLNCAKTTRGVVRCSNQIRTLNALKISRII